MRVKTKLLTVLVGIGMSAFAGVANADVDFDTTTPFQHTVTLETTVPASCTLSGSANKTGGFESDSNQTASTFTVEVSGSNAAATTGLLTIGDISCTTGQISVTISPDGWIANDSPSSADGIKYDAQVYNGSTPISESKVSMTDNNSGSGSATIPNMNAGIGVSISTIAATGLSSGHYVGTLRISFAPGS